MTLFSLLAVLSGLLLILWLVLALRIVFAARSYGEAGRYEGGRLRLWWRDPARAGARRLFLAVTALLVLCEVGLLLSALGAA